MQVHLMPRIEGKRQLLCNGVRQWHLGENIEHPGSGLVATRHPPEERNVIQDLLGAARVTDPQLSPDGKLVAFVRTTTDLASGKRNADIWIVPADGSATPRLLIGGDGSENTPRWDPDGSHLAFLSTRAGGPQIFAPTVR